MTALYLTWHWLTSWVIGWGGVGAIVTIAAWVLWYFTPAFLSESRTVLFNVAIGATVFTFASTYFFTNGYNAGYALAINQIAAKNKEAKDAVDKAITKVDECNNRGGTWDTVSGMCQ